MLLRIHVYTFLIVAAAGSIFDITDDILKKIKEIFQPEEKPKVKNTLGSGAFIRNFVAGLIPALEPFVELQLHLETIGEEAGLYRVSKQENSKILKKLREDPEVRRIIRECKKFHTLLTCKNSQYRTADGTCNNLKYPLWGSANVANNRFLPASYEGIKRLRKSVTGEDLLEPRNISLKLKNKNVPSKHVSALFTFYGQTIVHDMTLAPGISKNGTMLDCCPPSERNNSICENIYFSQDDPFYGQFNFTCMPFVRTAPYPTCNFEKRTPMNKKTSFVDVSLIYGSDVNESLAMRADDSSGRLKIQSSSYGEILPPNKDENALFCPINKTEECFLSGDERVNQHSMLMSLQTMLVRFHNIIADGLHLLNPHWDGEKVYEESRRIVVAVQQHILYTEYLPLLVGPDNMKKYNLAVDFNKLSLYNDKLSPTVFIEFSTAAFRLHSMVPKKISKFHLPTRMDTSYSFFEPIRRGHLASLVAGSCEVPSERNDRFIKKDVKGFLYRPPGAAFGTDLLAINVQRGRDHGLPNYVDVVEKCSNGKIKIKRFSDLIQLMTRSNIKLLKSMYSNVLDIDLWIGMIMETSTEGSVTGFTAACISSIQFHRVKFGDSFFYTHTNGRYPFTRGQLKFVQTISLSHWICKTTDYTKIRKHPLLIPGKNNPMVYCGRYPLLDLTAWKEKTSH